MDEGKLSRIERDRGWDLLLFGCAFFMLFWALGDRGLWTAEGRWAEITRQMLRRGDFFHPVIGGEPYFDKPLLTYWLIAFVAWTTGVLNEWAVRLPSAVAGLLAIWATRNLGARLWSVRVGRVAAWMLLSTYGLLFWSRTGTAEAENLAAIILAVAWYWARRDRPGFVTFLVFYLIMFTGALTKGLTAVIIPILAVLPDVLRQRRWRTLFSPAHAAAATIAAGLYLAPFIYASVTAPHSYTTDGLALVFRENIVRYFRPFDHKGPVYLYLYAIPALLFPWSPLWVAATAGAIRIRRFLDGNTRWLLEATALIFLFFTLSGSRRSYYILPILPFGTLLTAVFIVHIRDGRTRAFLNWGLGIQSGLLFGMVLLECVAPLATMMPQDKMGLAVPPGFVVAGVIIGGSALILKFIADRAPFNSPAVEGKPSITSAIVMAAAVMGGFFCVQLTILNGARTERPFVLDLKQKAADLQMQNIALFRTNCPTLQFYLGGQRPVQVLDDAAELSAFLAGAPSAVLVTRQKYRDQLTSGAYADFARAPDMAEAIRPWESASCRRNKWIVWLLKKPVDARQSNTFKPGPSP